MGALTPARWQDDTDSAGCRALWLSVLALGLADAKAGIGAGWLRSNDFVVVCHLAGVNPAHVRERFAAGALLSGPSLRNRVARRGSQGSQGGAKAGVSARVAARVHTLTSGLPTGVREVSP